MDRISIGDVREWFARAVPLSTDKNRAVQIGCHLEEVSEMCEVIGAGATGRHLEQLANFFKKAHSGMSRDEFTVEQKIALLDALCDQIVTAVGAAYMFGFDIEGALAEVNRSNFSKFVDGVPVFDENGKIAKPPTYSPADLRGFIGC